MSIVNYEQFRPSLVEPYINSSCLSIGKVMLLRAYPGNLYDTHDYFSGVPVTPLMNHTDERINFRGSNQAITEPFIIAQYHNTTIDMIRSKTPSHDLLTDILSGVYWSLCEESPESAYVMTQAYMLISRIAEDTIPFYGGKASKYKVKPYEF